MQGMNEPSTYYQIDVRGHASQRMLGPFEDDFALTVLDGKTTRLVGPIRDAAHLHGVINHLVSLAIDVISITPTSAPPGNNGAATSGPSDLNQATNERQQS